MNILSKSCGFLFCMIFSCGIASAQKDSVAIKKMLDEAYGFEVSAPQKALKIYRDSYTLSVKNQYWIGAFKSLQYSGLVHNDHGNYDSAIYFFQKSKPFAKKGNYARGEAQTFVNMGNTYQFEGNYNKAVSNYLSGLKIFETIKDSAALSQSYQNLSAIYTTLKNPELEILYLKKALQYSNTANKEQIGALYGDLGLTLLGQGKPEEALVYFKKTEALSNTSEDKRFRFLSKRNMGEYYNNLKMFDKAIAYYEEASKFEATAIEKNDLMYILSGLYFDMKNYPKSLVYTQQTIALAKEIKAREILYKAYRRLAMIYEKTNHPDKAFVNLTMSTNLKDSIMDENYLKQISLIQTQYETEKKDKAIARQQVLLNKNELELLLKEKQTVLYVIAILLLIMLSIGIWLFFHQRQKLKNKEIVALQQQQEITKLEALIDGEEKERRRIAQELHDGINGDLSAIKFRILGIDESNLSLDDKENLTTTVEMIDQSCAQVRNISHNLMPASIIDFGLVETVQQYCSKISQSHPLELDFQYFGNPASLPKKSETVIYRIIQELINNIIKHSQATTALVQMNFHENELFITVEDNGVGFDVKNAKNGLGLKNIESRIQLLKAGLEVDSSSKGTSFQINIDLNSIPK